MRLVPFHALLLSAAASSCPALAVAQERPGELVIVTGSRLSQSSSADETRITRAEIEARNPGDLSDLLRQAPGVSVSAPGGAGSVNEIFVRGAESNFTVVLIDGVRVNDPSNARGGGFDFSTLDPAEIEGVSVVRGPTSAVYGSDAMAGVIAIETAPPDQSRVRAEIGEDGFARAFASFGGALGEQARAGVSLAHSDLGEPIEGASQTLSSGALRLDWDGAIEGRAGIRYAQRERSGFPDASGGPMFAVIRDSATADAEELSVWGRGQGDLSNWRLDAALSFFTRDERIDTPAIAPGVFDGSPASTSDSRFDRVEAIASARTDVTDALEFSAGASAAYESGERVGSLDLGGFVLPSDFDLDRTTIGVFTEARYALTSSIALEGALRVDSADSDEARVSGRASGIFAPADDLIVRASFASGHKLPSFYALGDTLVGNPDLNVETSEAAELAVEKRFGDIALRATAFATRYEDIIDFDFTTFRLVNRSEARIDGIEVGFDAPAGENFHIAGHAVFSDIELDGEDRALLNRPERYGALAVTWVPAAAWSVRADAMFVGARSGSSIPTGDRELGGYERFDATVTREFGAQTALFVTAANVTDERYEEAAGFPSPGRGLRAGVRWTP